MVVRTDQDGPALPDSTARPAGHPPGFAQGLRWADVLTCTGGRTALCQYRHNSPEWRLSAWRTINIMDDDRTSGRY
jgi:hypothetical protein